MMQTLPGPAPLPTAPDLRALIGRHRLRLYHLAPLVGLHPSRLSLVLNEHAPLTPDLALRLAHAIAEEARSGVATAPESSALIREESSQ